MIFLNNYYKIKYNLTILYHLELNKTAKRFIYSLKVLYIVLS